MIGWLFIALSALCSVLIAHFLKVTESKNLDTVHVLTVNYLIATLIALLFSLNADMPDLSLVQSFQPILLACLVGVLFIANFFIYSKSVYFNGVGISIAAMRISLIVPVLLSTLWYFELLSAPQWIGVLLVFITLFLLLPRKDKILNKSFDAGWLLVLLFIGTGFGDASLKIFESEYSANVSKEIFMGMVFFTAFLVGLIIMFIRGKLKITKSELILGTAIGIPNLFTSIFLISALEIMNGAVVYSSVNVLTVMGGTLLGVIRWKDRFTNAQWVGIFLTLFSIVLLIL